MHITIIGLGYVGLTNAVYLASYHTVSGYDIDYNKLKLLNEGKEYLGEEYLQGYLNKYKKNLTFSEQYDHLIHQADVILIAVPTPEGENGQCDLTALEDAMSKVITHAKKGITVIIRSTVPPGTHKHVTSWIAKQKRGDLNLISMPEFLSLGTAINDMLEPARVVIGTLDVNLKSLIKKVFRYDTKIPMIVTSPQTAELIKYASNSLLATKVSFINEMSQIAELVDGNIEEVVEGIGLDPRIGKSFLKPGVGFGGSCFPKDLKALQYLAKQGKLDAKVITATLDTNLKQTQHFAQRILNHFNGKIEGKKIALLGLSYKGSTNDVRNSPAFIVTDMLTEQKAILFAYDKRATFDFFTQRGEKPCLAYVIDVEDALKDADCAVILNDAEELKALKAKDFIKYMKTPVVFDGRNLFKLDKMKGVEYHSVGRPTLKLK